ATVALLAVQYVLGLVARSVAVQSMEAASGRAVGVAHARVSVAGRQLVLSGVSVHSPTRPAEQYIEAERCELHFETGAALHKRAIFDRGRVDGLRFDFAEDGGVNEARDD